MNEALFNESQLASARTAYQLAVNQVASGDEAAVEKLPGLRAKVDALEGSARDAQAIQAAQQTQAKQHVAQQANEDREQAVAVILAKIDESRRFAQDIDEAFTYIRAQWGAYATLIEEVKRDIAPLIDLYASHSSIYGRRKAERLTAAWRGITTNDVYAALQRGAALTAPPNVGTAAIDLAEALQYLLPIPDRQSRPAAVEEPVAAEVEQSQSSAEEAVVAPEAVNVIDTDLLGRPLPMQTVTAEGGQDDAE